MGDTVTLFIFLVVLLCLSGFFSGSETGVMAVNKYKLQYAAKKNDKSAKILSELLKRPDRLLGVILLGNTFANILASAVMTVIAFNLFGDVGVLVATVILTVVVLVFSEVMPKTLAALHPDKVAYKVSGILVVLLKVLYPLVWFVNFIANAFLSRFGVDVKLQNSLSLQREELIGIIQSDSNLLSRSDQNMLTGILDLGVMRVEDVMVPRGQVTFVDIAVSWVKVMENLSAVRGEQVLIVNGGLDNCIGLLNYSDLVKMLLNDSFNKQQLLKSLADVVYIPASITVATQLAKFKQDKFKFGVVVDEYGDILGVLSLVDIIDEIIGEMLYVTTDKELIIKLADGFKVAGDTNVRDLNRKYGWSLPDDGPNTLSGLVIEVLEIIPDSPVSIKFENIIVEVVDSDDQKVNWVKIIVVD